MLRRWYPHKHTIQVYRNHLKKDSNKIVEKEPKTTIIIFYYFSVLYNFKMTNYAKKIDKNKNIDSRVVRIGEIKNYLYIFGSIKNSMT